MADKPPVPPYPEVMLGHRQKRFTFEAERVYDDLYDTDFIDIRHTINGTQWFTTSFTIEEWQKLIPAVQALIREDDRK